MSYNILAFLSIICGILGFIIKENAVRYRVHVYAKLNKINDQKKIKEAEKSYRIGIIIFSGFLILFGIWLLMK